MFPRFIFFCAPVLLLAQHGNTTSSNPHTKPEDREAGATIYRSTCTGCHGKEGSGGSAADLTTGQYRHGSSDAALFQAIASGIPGTPMPAFKLDARQIWQLVTYVRSLSEGRASEKAKGDPRKGAAVYAKAGCAQCHAIGGEGSFAGPDLTEVGATLSLGALQNALLNPDEDVNWDYWTVQATRRDGTQVTGRRMNEDSYSLQVLDAAGKLHSLDKESLESFGILRTSPMPSYKGKLSPEEFDNLIAYLASLKGDRP
jgi:cytochrome c oxidase cbb3-type subunit III